MKHTLLKLIALGLLVTTFICCNKDDGPVQDLEVEKVTETAEKKNQAPSSVTLSFPEDSSELQSVTPILQWTEAIDPEDGILTYKVMLGTSEHSFLPLAEGLNSLEFEMDSNLEKGTTYYWKVIAEDAVGKSSTSEIFNFTTEYVTVIKVTDNAAFSKRNFSTTTVFKGKLWVIGGEDQEGNVLADIWSSVDGANWNLETDNAEFGPRKGHALMVFKNRMWIYSGNNGSNLNNDIWSTDDGINWIKEENDSPFNTLPFYGQSATTMFVFDNKIWRLAAYDGSIGDLTTERYIWNSTDGKNWNLVSENHGFDSKFSMTVVHFQGKLIGIEATNGFSKVWQSTNGIEWNPIAEDLSFAIGYYPEAVLFDNRIFLTAGGDNNELWFTEDGISWKKAVQEREYPLRYANSSVIFNDKIYVIGGGTHRDQYNDVWALE